MRAMQITELGAPLRLAEVPTPVPAPGEVLVRVAACGMNFADTLMVEGRYQEKPALPFAPGLEVAGTVAACGPGATLAPGTRVVTLVAARRARRVCRRRGRSLHAAPRHHARRGRRGLPHRLWHELHRHRLARPPRTRRDPPRHRRRRRRRPHRRRDRRPARRTRHRRRPRRGQARHRHGGRRRPYARLLRDLARTPPRPRRARRRLRHGRRRLRRRPARDPARRTSDPDRLRRRRRSRRSRRTCSS